MLVRMWRNWNPRVMLVGNVKWCSHHRKHFSMLSKNQLQNYHMRAPIALPGIYPKETKSREWERYFCYNIRGSIIHNSQRWTGLKCPLTDEYLIQFTLHSGKGKNTWTYIRSPIVRGSGKTMEEQQKTSGVILIVVVLTGP